MLLAYIHCRGIESLYPELCIIPDKPDQFSGPVRVDSLIDTDCALLRLSPHEMLRVQRVQEENITLIEAVTPAKLLLIPAQQDRPGSEVKRVKIVTVGERKYRVYYLQDLRDSNSWKEWIPNQSSS